MPSIDLAASLLALGLLAVGAVCYAVRLAILGSATSARVNAAGSSPLLSKGAMEFGYWCLQPFGRFCIRVGLSPDEITFGSLLFGAGAGVSLACGHFGLGALLASISGLGDVLDGLVARETKTTNGGGAVFDASVDRYTEFFFLGGLAFSQRDNGLLAALALLALLGSYMISYGSAKAEALRVPMPRGVMRRAERAIYLCCGLLLSPLVEALVGSGRLPAWTAQVPVLGTLALVALVSNISAALRLRTIARSARNIAFDSAVPVVALPLAPPVAVSSVVPINAAVALGTGAATSAKSAGTSLANPSNLGAPSAPLRISRPATQR